MSEQAKDSGKGAAVYQYRLASGDWRDQSEVSYRNNLTNCPDKVRIVYTAPRAQLSDDRINQIISAWYCNVDKIKLAGFARAIEQAVRSGK
jgi:hypothetical protein